MSDLDSIVQVTITAETRTPTRRGFGTPLIAGYFPTTIFAERVRAYAEPSEMVTDGFPAAHPMVRAAQAVAAQSPRPRTFKVGRRANAPSQAVDLTPTVTTEGAVVALDIVSPDGTVTTVSRANGAAETVASICTALTALIDAVTGLGASDDTTHVSCTADNAGDLFDFANLVNLDVEDITADPGLAADLTAIQGEDADWYGLALDSNSAAEVAVAAAWAESAGVLLGASSADADVANDVTGNLGETLDAASYERTFLIWNKRVLSNIAARALGSRLATDPGSSTWKFKRLSGAVADALSTTQRGNLDALHVNHYTRLAGLDVLREGVLASGQFIDVRRTIDALHASLQEEIFAALANAEKLPYTDASVSLVKGIILGVLREFQQTGALDPETDPVVTAPRVSEISASNRASRVLPDVDFQARLGGAFHSIVIAGRLVA